jgi:glycogenin glucosyltransferase
MGVHGALLVLVPSMDEFRRIRRDLRRPEIRRLVSDAFRWPDMQYLTMRWSGLWTSVDARFCGLNGYPTPAVLDGTHFAGVKPWSARDPRALRRLLRFPDHALWFERFREMVVRDRPGLLQHARLRRLVRSVDGSRPQSSP